MFNKFFFASLSLLWSIIPIAAQENIPSSCETVEKTDEEMERLPWYGNNDVLNQFRISDSAAFLFNGQSVIEDRSGNSCPDIDEMFLIPIRFWIYRETENDPATPTEVQLSHFLHLPGHNAFSCFHHHPIPAGRIIVQSQSAAPLFVPAVKMGSL